MPKPESRSVDRIPRAPGVPIQRTLCLLAGAALLADSLFLLAQRVFSFGVTLPLGIGGVLLFFGLRWHPVHAWRDASLSRRRLWRWGWAALWLWITSVALFWILLAHWTAGLHALPSQPAAAIVVLGSGTPGGKVSPVLASRLDLAYERALATPGAVVVTSGGVDFNQARSEAAVMGDYLRIKGLPPERVVQEEQSTSTAHNLLLSRRLLEQRGIVVAREPVELVTSDFHTLRARWIAERAGYAQPRMVGAPTPLYVRYNAWLREYFALISGFLMREY